MFHDHHSELQQIHCKVFYHTVGIPSKSWFNESLVIPFLEIFNRSVINTTNDVIARTRTVTTIAMTEDIMQSLVSLVL